MEEQMALGQNYVPIGPRARLPARCRDFQKKVLWSHHAGLGVAGSSRGWRKAEAFSSVSAAILQR
jgi:hypothetical protein